MKVVEYERKIEERAVQPSIRKYERNTTFSAASPSTPQVDGTMIRTASNPPSKHS